MQTANKLSNRPSASPVKSRVAPPLPHAIRLLEADHAEVSRCFKEYQKLVKRKAGANRARIARAAHLHLADGACHHRGGDLLSGRPCGAGR